jgi:hypothetical protein
MADCPRSSLQIGGMRLVKETIRGKGARQNGCALQKTAPIA